MKAFTIVCVVAVSIVATSAGHGDLMDTVDFEAVVRDDDQRNAMVDCLLDKGNCGDYTVNIKDMVGKLLETKCGTCTPSQKEKYQRVEDYMKEKHPEQHSAIIAKYGLKPQ